MPFAASRPCVVVQHSLELLYPAWAKFSLERFRLGEFGVVVFFLCSGFIIPASLERQGSQAKFWIGRMFRLFPLYWSVLAAVLVLHYGFDKYGLPQAYLDHPIRATVANATMLQNFLSQPLALGQSWSLAYELVFYGLVSAMFVTGLHKRSPLWATLAFVTAMVINTRHVPNGLVHDLVSEGGNRLFLIAALSLIVGVGYTVWVTRRVGPQKWLSIGIVAFAILLVLNRQNEGMSQAMFFFGTLFYGTCLYRWSAGEMELRRLVALTALAITTIVVLWTTADIYWGLPYQVSTKAYRAAEILTYVAAYAVFLLALRFRTLRFPKVLLWLGTISYSLYLTHAIPIYAIGQRWEARPVDLAVWIGSAVVLSTLTYHFIEKPSIRMGRKVSARLVPKATTPAS
jgi:peptidoglycan/LPS O-acetylase OafA/YrhL